MEKKLEIRKFIVQNFLYGQDDGFQNGDSLLDMGLIDSTGVLELVSFVEENFKINVNDEEIVPENFDSVDNLEKFINWKEIL